MIASDCSSARHADPGEAWKGRRLVEPGPEAVTPVLKWHPASGPNGKMAARRARGQHLYVGVRDRSVFLSAVAALLEFACGRAALVCLARLSGESPHQRGKRIDRGEPPGCMLETSNHQLHDLHSLVYGGSGFDGS
jgi:hypothetical protein